MKCLSNVTVVDLTANLAGPFSTLIMHDMGARVIKIESPRTPDPVRQWPPFSGTESSTFAALNRGKESIALDLKHTSGQEIFEKLVLSADVLVQSMLPGAVERLGLSFERLSEMNPRLVYCDISAFGNTGELAGQPGYDAVLQAYSGIMNLTGEKDGPPVRVGTGIIDFGTGMWAAIGVLGALLQRQATGRGSHVETTMLATAVGFQPHHIASVTMANVVPKRLGSAQHNSAPYETIRTSDGLVLVGAANDAIWRRLCVAIGNPELLELPQYSSNAERVKNRDALVKDIERSIGDTTAKALLASLSVASVPASIVRSVADLVADQQVAALGLLGVTPSGATLPVTPYRDTSTSPIGDAPALGAHSQLILESLGIGDHAIRSLAEDGAVAGQGLG
jgi:CoA:oxalate CoA-transferase